MLMGLLIIFVLLMFISSFMPAMIDAVTSVVGMPAGAATLVDNTILFLIIIFLVVIIKLGSERAT